MKMTFSLDPQMVFWPFSTINRSVTIVQGLCPSSQREVRNRAFGIKICLECFETGSLDRFVGHRNSRLYA